MRWQVSCTRHWVARLREHQAGITLLETVISIGLLGLVGTGVIAGLGGAFSAQDISKQKIRAENLARGQLEDIRNQTYLASYPVTVTLPTDFALTIDTQPFCAPEPCTSDDNIQKNTVKVTRGGKPLIALSDLKSKR